ncbi:unnamed protein product [Cyclocybe aegerita]|uniref:Thioredoxin domain-containing protein n=1 Tax=Cyclocybe aegerita TaxID=1973307 RepID=A0A8S0VX73_CYCAE|nr:unnamed protein product [Cyclocybe aegerita]
MSITHIISLSQLNGILSKDKGKLSVIDFHATWSGSMHSPVYESLAKQYPNVNFLKCDVDAASEVAKQYSVSAMPTFVFLKGSTKVDQVRGANRAALEATLKSHAVASKGSAFTGRGQTLGGAPATPDVVAEAQGALNGITGQFNQLDPQLKVMLGLLALYFVFWFFG